MQILTADIGTGTQDLFLYDSRLDLENGLKLIVPSPTMIIHQRLDLATRQRQPVLLTGVMMGGGPSQWAAEAHLRAGLPLFATPQAARTFNDDLDVVREMGVQVVSEDEAASLPGDVLRMELRDFDFPAIARAFSSFGVTLDKLDAVAVAVFDHGDSPPGYSDRQFRFDYLDRRIREENRLSAFAYRSEKIPQIMTRLQAVVHSCQGIDAPVILMDTAPAAVLGALFDPLVAARKRTLVANVGNFHTLAFRLGDGEPNSRLIEGVFEHHTGLIDLPKLEDLLRRLADGSLQHEDVFDDHGHGALIYTPQALNLEEGDFNVVVTGPRRGIFNSRQTRSLQGDQASIRPYFAVPAGDMMIAGCIGLLAATADLMPELGDTIRSSLRGSTSGAAPWDLK